MDSQYVQVRANIFDPYFDGSFGCDSTVDEEEEEEEPLWETMQKVRNMLNPDFDGRSIKIRKDSAPPSPPSTPRTASSRSQSSGGVSASVPKAKKAARVVDIIEKMRNVGSGRSTTMPDDHPLKKLANILEPHFDGRSMNIIGCEDSEDEYEDTHEDTHKDTLRPL